MTSEVPAIQAQGLTKSYGGLPVLQGIDLTVPQGESLVILGPSGGGKSTLLRCLIGLERPDSGTVLLQGVDIFRANHRELRALRRRIGMAFQRGALFGSMTLAGNIDLPLKEHTRLPLSTRKIIARIKLGLVGMEDAMNLSPSQLSGGMRKRGALARAMALDPSLLFFDEPSAGLDPVSAAGLDLLLKRMKEVFKVTLVVVTHEMVSAFSIADRVVLLHNGRFLVSGSPAAVQKSQHPIVRNFLDRVPPESSLDEGKYGKFFTDHQSKRSLPGGRS